MNFLDVRAGDNIEVGTQVAFRFWRYVFPPLEAPSSPTVLGFQQALASGSIR